MVDNDSFISYSVTRLLGLFKSAVALVLKLHLLLLAGTLGLWFPIVVIGFLTNVNNLLSSPTVISFVFMVFFAIGLVGIIGIFLLGAGSIGERKC